MPGALVTSAQFRRATGLGILSAAGALATIGAVWVVDGLLQVFAVVLVAPLMLLALFLLRQALTLRRQERLELDALALVRGSLPDGWYLLTDLLVPSSWGEPVAVWAVVITPGGLLVLQSCTAGGAIRPAGAVWVVGVGTVIPSPINRCRAAVAALQERVNLGRPVPVHSLVVLTDPQGVYHPAPTEATVVGAPHLGATVIHYGAGAVLKRREIDQLAVNLSQYYR